MGVKISKIFNPQVFFSSHFSVRNIPLGVKPSGNCYNFQSHASHQSGLVEVAGAIQAPQHFKLVPRNLESQLDTGDTGGASADVVTMIGIDPVGLKDSQILTLRASMKTSRKLVDDLILEIIETVEKAKDKPSVPKNMVSDYSLQ